jgi:hypothetical protein
MGPHQPGSLHTLVYLCLVSLAGCGTSVPNITEFWGDRDSSVLAVNAVANQLQCELKRSVQDVMNDRVTGPQVTKLISKWIVQVNLNLTIDEQTQFNPGVSLKDPFAPVKTTFPSGNIITNPTFSLGIGANTSADTARVQKLTFLYKISDLVQLPFGLNPSISACVQNMPPGYLMTQSDLKIEEALRAGILPYTIQGASIPPSAIVHQVTFKINTNGGITPVWTLVRVTANTTNPLLGVTRNRTQDVIFTFGPASQQEGQQPVLAQPAQNAAFAAEIGSAIATSLQQFTPTSLQQFIP